MTPAELRTRLEPLLGPTWQARLARGLGLNVRTVRSFAGGRLAIPGYVVAIVDLLEAVLGVGERRNDVLSRFKIEPRSPP